MRKRMCEGRSKLVRRRGFPSEKGKNNKAKRSLCGLRPLSLSLFHFLNDSLKNTLTWKCCLDRCTSPSRCISPSLSILPSCFLRPVSGHAKLIPPFSPFD